MLRYLIVASVLSALPVLSSCVYKEYDPRHPGEYSNFWNDEEHRKGSPAYPFTNGAGDDRERGRNGPYNP